MGNQCMDEKSLQQVFEENVIELALTISDQIRTLRCGAQVEGPKPTLHAYFRNQSD